MTENIANNNANHYNETTPCLLPNFCEVRNIFFIVLFTEVLAIIFAMAVSSSSTQFWDYLALSSLLMLWIALLNAAVLCTLRNWLDKQKPAHCMLLSYGLMIMVSLLVASMADLASSWFYLKDENYSLNSLFFIRVMTISAVIYFLLLRYFYVQYQWRLNLAAQSLAQIQALRARIRPHFLFNSMNTIASLIEISPRTAEKAIEDLSDLFRASLSEKDINRLSDEIELAESYLAIESLRLGERLQTEWKIEQNLLDKEIPSLCIQPLAENAVYHGIEPLPEGGKILISALQVGNKLKISVSNPLMPEAQKSKKGNQMAQDNIKQRLKLVYGDNGEFSINETKESYTVTLSIPLT